MENVEPQNLSSPNGKRTDFKEEKSLSNAEALLALYPDPGSNRDGLPHWCLRPARLPIPPSGRLLLKDTAKLVLFSESTSGNRYFFIKTRFIRSFRGKTRYPIASLSS